MARTKAPSTPRAAKKRAAAARTPVRKAVRKAAPPPEPPSRYFHREESWLAFNERVLEEADDPTNPLLERVKFLAITASNLDEFIEIRIAGELQRMEEEEGFPQRPDE